MGNYNDISSWSPYFEALVLVFWQMLFLNLEGVVAPTSWSRLQNEPKLQELVSLNEWKVILNALKAVSSSCRCFAWIFLPDFFDLRWWLLLMCLDFIRAEVYIFCSFYSLRFSPWASMCVTVELLPWHDYIIQVIEGKLDYWAIKL